MNNEVNNTQPVKESLGTAAFVIGIISLVLCLFLNIIILPLAIVGIILGVVNKIKGGKKISGIILNMVAIFLVAIELIIVVVIFGSAAFGDFLSQLRNEMEASTSNYLVGKYDCKQYDSSSSDYSITLYLNSDNTFLYGPYSDLDNNYAKGTYTYVDEDKTSNDGKFKYYMITMNGKKEDFIVDGKPASKDFNSKAEMGISRTNGSKKQAVLMFVSTYNTYYCYER